MTRPEHLPDFENPPLDELVLGVQFAPIPKYTAVLAKDIWSLFKSDFPNVVEQPILEPRFEAFGGANPQPNLQFQIGPPPIGSRLWFVSADDNHLLQFQPDRFLINWRKRPQAPGYPRFEGIADRFAESLHTLVNHLNRELQYTVDINQAEISYINMITVDDFSEMGRWIKSWGGDDINIEAMNTVFVEVISDENKRPYARLVHEIQSLFSVDGKRKVIKLALTFRGKPRSNEVSSALEFLALGRDKIVTRFTNLTTDRAHEIWGRQR